MKKLLLLFIVLSTVAVGSALAQGEILSSDEKTLYIIDGRVVSKAELDKIPPQIIKSMTVVKDINQVTIITTNGNGVAVVDSTCYNTHPRMYKNRVRCNQPLYVIKDVQGNIYSQGDKMTITPQMIKSMTIIKDVEKLENFKQYGDISRGVIFIELK